MVIRYPISHSETIYYSNDPISMNHLNKQKNVLHIINLENSLISKTYLYVYASMDTSTNSFVITSTNLIEQGVSVNLFTEAKIDNYNFTYN